MNRNRLQAPSRLVVGAVAGLAGTAVLMGMRSFDRRYSPKTIPKTRDDPGAFMVKRAERAIGQRGKIPKRAGNAGAMLMHVGYGTVAGVFYAAIRGRRRHGSALLDGGLIGCALYAVGYVGWLPLLRLTRPIWKQPFPQIAGEALRHAAYGITTAAVYGAINARYQD